MTQFTSVESLTFQSGQVLQLDRALDAEVRKRVNRLLRKRFGPDYHTNTSELLLLTPVPLASVFGVDGKVIYKSKPYPKVVADRAFELYSEGKGLKDIAETLDIGARLVRKWHEQLDWDERLSRQKSEVDTQYSKRKVDNAVEKRERVDAKHKEINEWLQTRMLAELNKDPDGKSAAEEQYLKVRSIKTGWEAMKAMMDHERQLLGIKEEVDQVILPNHFLYEIQSPEGQKLAESAQTLEDYLPNQNPHTYIPVKNLDVNLESKHISEIPAEPDADGNLDTINVHGKKSADKPPEQGHFYRDPGFMSFG